MAHAFPIDDKKHSKFEGEYGGVVERAISETFSKFLKTNVQCEILPYSEKASLDKDKDVSGVVGLVRDDGIEGTFSVHFSKKTLFPLLSKFFKTEINTVDNLTTESVGEITNMIFGIIKEHLNDQEFGYRMCLPVVIVGASHEVFSSVEGYRLLVAVTTGDNEGKFWCEMVLHRTGAEALLSA